LLSSLALERPAFKVHPETQVCREIPEAPVNPDYRASLASMAPQALKGHVDPKVSKEPPDQPDRPDRRERPVRHIPRR